MKENIQETFVILKDEIIDGVLKDTKDPICLSVYYMLLRHRNRKTNQSFPSISKLAQELQTSKSTIKRRIDLLYEYGYIDINSGEKGIANNYYFPKESFYEDFKYDTQQQCAYRKKSSTFKTIKQEPLKIKNVKKINNHKDKDDNFLEYGLSF